VNDESPAERLHAVIHHMQTVSEKLRDAVHRAIALRGQAASLEGPAAEINNNPESNETDREPFCPPVVQKNYALVDMVNGYTSPEDQIIGEYDIEQPGSFLNAAGPGGPTLADALSNASLSAIPAGAAVCAGGSTDSVQPCQTGSYTAVVGVAAAAIAPSATGPIIVTGIAPGVTEVGPCNIGNYATLSATSGEVDCASSFAGPGTALGVVMSISGTPPGATVSVLVAPR
jgi:hypothetical protein